MTVPVVAVIGASGFIGNRIIEMLHLSGRLTVRAVARRAEGLAMASGLGVEGRVADGFDTAALTEALQGCDLVVHALAGDRHTIVGTVAPVYEAAERAGCRRIVYLSSAVVHGQAPAADTDERSPLSLEQPIAYNVSKILAEAELLKLRRSGSVEAVIVRPGIVYGPRSQWITGIADAVLASEAYLIDGGSGLCNAIYVDNVVAAILRCFDVAEADGEAFLIGEDETPTWHELYEKIASALGRSMAGIPSLTFEQHAPTLLERLRQSRPVKAIIGPKTGPSPTLEMALLHTSRHVPSWQKARAILGYAPVVSADEAWRRTIAWMAEAGYPVMEAQHD